MRGLRNLEVFGPIMKKQCAGGKLGIILKPPSSQRLCTSTELSCMNKVWDDQCILADVHSIWEFPYNIDFHLTS